MNIRENLLRNARFERPDWIPVQFNINLSCWRNFPQQALQELMADHPLLFPGFKKKDEKIVPEFPFVARADEPYVDDWGCRWETTEDGITGIVTGHPLASWDAFEGFVSPDPEHESGIGPVDWKAVEDSFAFAEREGRLKWGGLRHGHAFLQLCDLRGYENLLYDMADEEPRLQKLVDQVEAFNMKIVERYLGLGVEWLSYPEDLGMQKGPMLSPDMFRRYIKPVYQRLMAPARDAGCVIHMHCDGDIRALAHDLLECGMHILNVQDRVNGIDWIRHTLSGKVGVDLDIDRQHVTVSGTPDEIDQLILDAVKVLGSKEGGFSMVYELFPGVPLENARAVMDAMEKYAHYYA
ncbi:MAG: hypothetical protein KJ645_07270 [Planctomycetes bacterium]|nr:hypothetical protein [Planctomycetota bacterium]